MKPEIAGSAFETMAIVDGGICYSFIHLFIYLFTQQTKKHVKKEQCHAIAHVTSH